MHKGTKSRYKSYEILSSGLRKRIFLLTIMINISFQLYARASSDLVKLGGTGTVNPFIFESVSQDELLVGGSFRGELEIQELKVNAAGGEDVFIALFEDKKVRWLRRFGNGDNDMVADRVWVRPDHSIELFVIFWDEINIDGEIIENPGGGRALLSVRLDATDGSVMGTHLFPVRGAVDNVKIRAVNGEKCYLSGLLDGDLLNGTGEASIEKFSGVFVGTLDDEMAFRLVDTVRAAGKCILSGIAADENAVMLVGFFNGRLIMGDQIEETVSVYDDGFMILVGDPDGGRALKRFGGIFDNNFVGVEAGEEKWFVSGHFTGVLELGDGKELETQDFNSDFVLLEVDDDLKVSAFYQSGGANAVRNFDVKKIEEKLYFGNQYFGAYSIGTETENCESQDIASSIVSFAGGDFISEGNFCLEGNVNNPLYAKLRGGVFSFTTGSDFEFMGKEYRIEGINDSFIYFAEVSFREEYTETGGTLHFYPNPAAGSVNIEVSENAVMEIYNSQGALIQRSAMLAGERRVIHFSSGGIYFIGVAGGRKGKLMVKEF